MTNEIKGEVELVVGEGKDAERYVLVFTANAFCEAEWALDGRTTDQMLADYSAGRIGIRMVRALIYGGLQANHPCHLIRAGEIVSEAGMVAARMAAGTGLLIAFGRRPEDDPAPDADDGGEGGEGARP